jgi:hypothetical protein
MGERGLIRTQVQLTETQMRELKRIAEKEGISVAEAVRRGVDLYLRQCAGPSPEERIRRAMSIVGRFQGPPDLAEEHDRYFAAAAKDE